MSKQVNKEIRCINCNNIIAKGYMKEGVIEIPCKSCKTVNKIDAEQQPYGERRDLKTKESYMEYFNTNRL